MRHFASSPGCRLQSAISGKNTTCCEQLPEVSTAFLLLYVKVSSVVLWLSLLCERLRFLWFSCQRKRLDSTCRFCSFSSEHVRRQRCCWNEQQRQQAEGMLVVNIVWGEKKHLFPPVYPGFIENTSSCFVTEINEHLQNKAWHSDAL